MCLERSATTLNPIQYCCWKFGLSCDIWIDPLNVSCWSLGLGLGFGLVLRSSSSPVLGPRKNSFTTYWYIFPDFMRRAWKKTNKSGGRFQFYRGENNEVTLKQPNLALLSQGTHNRGTTLRPTSKPQASFWLCVIFL